MGRQDQRCRTSGGRERSATAERRRAEGLQMRSMYHRLRAMVPGLSPGSHRCVTFAEIVRGACGYIRHLEETLEGSDNVSDTDNHVTSCPPTSPPTGQSSDHHVPVRNQVPVPSPHHHQAVRNQMPVQSSDVHPTAYSQMPAMSVTSADDAIPTFPGFTYEQHPVGGVVLESWTLPPYNWSDSCCSRYTPGRAAPDGTK
ncbi:uncharacterized protein LOC119433175 isoform X4 [Dermacentor silvarum]|uniref:uncharacterized protein LOC119433175 isoform X4 n=1 Tax=Dermacentor silvarum TaxID=543639 RepID=UPI00189AF8A4|nr:uncharacterized protein LOC119433175 isoform X4 [Dermacentor silvarum]